MSMLKRMEIPLILFAVTSIFLIFEYFTGIGKEAAIEIIGWGILLSVFSYLLGYVSLIRYHIVKISKRDEGWPYSIIVFICFIVSFIAGMVHKPTFDYIFVNILTPLQISMLSYVGFYTYTIFFRGARTRNLYAALLLAVAVVIMLWQAPAARSMVPPLGPIGEWIKNVPNTGAMRAVMIGIGLGLISLFLRTLLGYEKAFLGGE